MRNLFADGGFAGSTLAGQLAGEPVEVEIVKRTDKDGASSSFAAVGSSSALRRNRRMMVHYETLAMIAVRFVKLALERERSRWTRTYLEGLLPRGECLSWVVGRVITLRREYRRAATGGMRCKVTVSSIFFRVPSEGNLVHRANLTSSTRQLLVTTPQRLGSLTKPRSLRPGTRWRLVVGGPDGLSDTALAAAQLRLSLGAITLPHGLARTVLAEQLYRAVTILSGHPYHRG